MWSKHSVKGAGQRQFVVSREPILVEPRLMPPDLHLQDRGGTKLDPAVQVEDPEGVAGSQRAVVEGAKGLRHVKATVARQQSAGLVDEVQIDDDELRVGRGHDAAQVG